MENLLNREEISQLLLKNIYIRHLPAPPGSPFSNKIHEVAFCKSCRKAFGCNCEDCVKLQHNMFEDTICPCYWNKDYREKRDKFFSISIANKVEPKEF